MEFDSEGGEGAFEFRSRDEFRKNLNNVQSFPDYVFETCKEMLLNESKYEMFRTWQDTVAYLACPVTPADIHMLPSARRKRKRYRLKHFYFPDGMRLRLHVLHHVVKMQSPALVRTMRKNV